MIISGLQPDKGVIKVTHNNGKETYHSALLSISGYIHKCESEGKHAELVGVADHNGQIKIEI